MLRKGWEIKGVGGREENGSLSLVAFAFFYPPSLFSPVTQLRKSVSVKLLLRRGGRSRKGVGGREGNGSLCLFALAFFSLLPFSFSTCHAASKESMKTKVNSLSRTTSRPALTVESRVNVTPVKAQPIRNGHTSV